MTKLEEKLIELGYINCGLTSFGYRYVKHNSIVIYYNKQKYKITGFNNITTMTNKLIKIINDDLEELKKYE